MLPASYADESLEAGVAATSAREELGIPGPRFAALVDLRLEPLAKQPPASPDASSAVKPAAKKPKPKLARRPAPPPGKPAPYSASNAET
jgi:hypothetical protein